METVHFRVGADAGILLMNIAQEHLLYGLDINKALTVFSDSFGGGCPKELQLELLRGDKVIEVDEDKQLFYVVPRDPSHEKKFPARLDFVKWFEEQQRRLDDHCDDIDKGLDQIINKFRYTDTYKMDFSVKAVIDYLYGKDETLIEEIQYDYELNQMQSLIRITKDFIEKSLKLSGLAKHIKALYELEVSLDTYELMNLAQKVKDIASLNFIYFTEGSDDTLTAYLEATKEIDAVITKGIVSIDIMDNYSAGWLSPEGEYYALNGEIANMLHTQIADALQEKGMIPMYDNDEEQELDIKTNPDAWLEQHGWVKIHGNNVHFAGNLNPTLSIPIVHITDKQIEIIRDYITDCHACMIKAGWRLEKASIGMFTTLAMRNKTALYKKYFDF